MNLFIQKIIFLQRAEIEENKQKWNEKFSAELLTSFLCSPVCWIVGDVPQPNALSSELEVTEVTTGGLAGSALYPWQGESSFYIIHTLSVLQDI